MDTSRIWLLGAVTFNFANGRILSRWPNIYDTGHPTCMKSWRDLHLPQEWLVAIKNNISSLYELLCRLHHMGEIRFLFILPATLQNVSLGWWSSKNSCDSKVGFQSRLAENSISLEFQKQSLYAIMKIKFGAMIWGWNFMVFSIFNRIRYVSSRPYSIFNKRDIFLRSPRFGIFSSNSKRPSVPGSMPSCRATLFWELPIKTREVLSCSPNVLSEFSDSSGLYPKNWTMFLIARIDGWWWFFSQSRTDVGDVPSSSAAPSWLSPLSNRTALTWSPRVAIFLGYPSGFRNSLNSLGCNMATHLCRFGYEVYRISIEYKH